MKGRMEQKINRNLIIPGILLFLKKGKIIFCVFFQILYVSYNVELFSNFEACNFFEIQKWFKMLNLSFFLGLIFSS